MTQASINEALAEQLAPPGSPTYQYYRQPNKWITGAAGTELEENAYRRGGWEPLRQYGRFEMTSLYSVTHPLELLFMAGGAHEVCDDQVRQQGLYTDNTLVPACHTPLSQFHKHHKQQCYVGGKTVSSYFADREIEGPFSCRFCGSVKPTVAARDQHESVVHKEEKGDIRTGETLAASLARGLNPGAMLPQGTDNSLLAEMAARMEAMAKELEELKARRPMGRPQIRNN